MSFLPLTVLFFVMMYVCNNLIASVSVEWTRRSIFKNNNQTFYSQ
jgi:hypothetical protein